MYGGVWGGVGGGGGGSRMPGQNGNAVCSVYASGKFQTKNIITKLKIRNAEKNRSKCRQVFPPVPGI